MHDVILHTASNCSQEFGVSISHKTNYLFKIRIASWLLVLFLYKWCSIHFCGFCGIEVISSL